MSHWIAMLSLLRRWLSPEYRRALAAEAAGNYLAAARSYALCGQPLKVADMHLARARLENTLDGQIRVLRVAFDLTTAHKERHAFIARMLADRIGAKADALDARSQQGRLMRLETASMLEHGEAWAEAGERYHALGETDSAVRAFGRAGLIERVEQVLEERERVEQASRIAHDSYADYQVALQEGACTRAFAALERYVMHTTDQGANRQLLAELRERVFARHVRIGWLNKTLQLIGRLPALLGRDPATDMMLRGTTVSREHARISFNAQACRFYLEDTGSRNGTFIDSLPLVRPIALADATTFRLGDDGPVIRVSIRPMLPAAVVLEVTEGLDRGTRAIVAVGKFDLSDLIDTAPSLIVDFDQQPFVVSPGKDSYYLLNGVHIRQDAEIISGNVLTVGGVDLVVT